jgi:hypothetical protein
VSDKKGRKLSNAPHSRESLNELTIRVGARIGRLNEFSEIRIASGLLQKSYSDRFSVNRGFAERIFSSPCCTTSNCCIDKKLRYGTGHGELKSQSIRERPFVVQRDELLQTILLWIDAVEGTSLNEVKGVVEASWIFEPQRRPSAFPVE